MAGQADGAGRRSDHREPVGGETIEEGGMKPGARRGAGVAPLRGMLWGYSLPWAEAARLPSDSRSATGKAGDEPSPPRYFLIFFDRQKFCANLLVATGNGQGERRRGAGARKLKGKC